MLTNVSPDLTCVLAATEMNLITPDDGALTSVSIFIASNTNNVSPSETLSPS